MPDREARAVIVAPTEYDTGIHAPALPYQVQEIVDALTAFYQPAPPLLGRVTDRQVAAALRSGCDIFWFIGHGAAGPTGGLLLSDGYLSGQDIGRYLGRAGARWAYINACDSAALVEVIQAIHPRLDVYANITTIDDKDAARNAMLLAQGIADLGRVQMAYRAVVTGGNSKLRYFPAPYGSEGVGGVKMRDGEGMERRVQRLERIVLGDEDTGAPGWLAQMGMINRRLRRIEMIMILSAVGLMFAILLAAAMIGRTAEPTIIYRPAPTPTPAYYYPDPVPAPHPPVATPAPATPIPGEMP